MDVTLAERLWLWRKAAKMAQATAAGMFGIGERAYRDIEAGRRGLANWPPALRARIEALVITDPMLLRLCRRRAGTDSRGTATDAGYGSHVALLKAERRGDPQLFDYWREKGVYKPAGGA